MLNDNMKIVETLSETKVVKSKTVLSEDLRKSLVNSLMNSEIEVNSHDRESRMYFGAKDDFSATFDRRPAKVTEELKTKHTIVTPLDNGMLMTLEFEA